MLRAQSYLEPDAFLKPCQTLTRHIQNPVIGHYLAIFRHIQNLVQHLHTQKLGILEILEHSELFHNCIPTHIQSPVTFRKLYEYSELSQTRHIFRRFKMELFAKIVKNYNCFSKALHLRSLTGFRIHLSLNRCTH